MIGEGYWMMVIRSISWMGKLVVLEEPSWVEMFEEGY